MQLTFLKILEECKIDTDRFEFLNDDYLELKILGLKEVLTYAKEGEEEELKKYKLEIKEEYENICKTLGEYYFNKVYYEKWYLSTEDIARHLNLTVNFTQTNVVKHLDRIEFSGSSDYAAKELIKEYVEKKMEDLYKDNDNISDIKEEVRGRFRKKILYSQQSYIKFLEEISTVEESKTMIKIQVPSEIPHAARMKGLFSARSASEQNMIKTLFNMFLEKREKEIKECSMYDRFDFKAMLDSRFNKIFDNTIDYCGDFKSKSSLKILFNKLYDIEIDRIIKSPDVESTTLNLNFNGNKRPTKRFLLNKDFLIENIKSNITMDSPKREENIGFEFKVNIPRGFFVKRYNSNPLEVEKDFIQEITKIIEGS